MKAISKTIIADIIKSLAATGHEDWRKGYQAGLASKQQPTDTPRWKPTSDSGWLQQNTNLPYANAAKGEVNINIEFKLLPADLQAENLADAAVCVGGVLKARSEGKKLEDRIEAISADVHAAWVARQEAAEILEAAAAGITLEEQKSKSYFRQQKQDAPFEALSQPEADKDRVRVRAAIEALSPHIQ
jgi:hypothetical protein